MSKPGDGSPTDCNQSEQEWKVNTAQARNTAKLRGAIPSVLERLVDALMEPNVDWRDVLRQFVNSHARNDYQWLPPNKRHVWQGIYLPGLRSEELGEIDFAIDTSGSIGQEELTRFASEAQGILEAYDCKLRIIYCDAAVGRVDEWSSSDGPLKLRPVGGGGTSHVPVWEWIKKSGKTPVCCLCLTDLDTDFGQDPGFPVMWCYVHKTKPSVPFGIAVSVDLKG